MTSYRPTMALLLCFLWSLTRYAIAESSESDVSGARYSLQQWKAAHQTAMKHYMGSYTKPRVRPQPRRTTTTVTTTSAPTPCTQPPTPPVVTPQCQVNKSLSFGIVYVDKCPFTYLKDGKLAGFTVDLIRHVCRIAGKRCHVVHIPEKECNRVVEKLWYPGKAVSWGDIDACVWWPVTTERMTRADFTLPYQPEPPSRWLVRPGNPYGFTPPNLNGHRIAVVYGWHSSEGCIRSVGLEGGTVEVYDSKEDAIDAVKTGMADALFSPLTVVGGLQLLPVSVKCATGAAMLTRKGSDLPGWWDPAFAHYVRCGCYRRLCLNAYATYGKAANCLDLPTGQCSASEQQYYCGV